LQSVRVPQQNSESVSQQRCSPRGPYRPVSHSAVAVPVAVAGDGSLVRPHDAVPDQTYRCPGCGAQVVLRRGEVRRPHFAHRGGEGCSSESTLHRAAKVELLRVVEQWKSGSGPRPCVSRPCPRYDCDGGVVQDIPDDITHASAEVRLSGGLVGDVVLYRGDKLAAVIEVLATSRVDAEKARRFSSPWVELRAEDILDRPYWWVAVQDGLQPFTCPRCAERGEAARLELSEIQRRAVEIARRQDLALPPSPPYHHVPHVCWRCRSEMVAYVWPGGSDHSPSRPPDPIPDTVQHRVTEGAGNYWANCCPRCSTVQGDYYLSRDNVEFVRVRELSEAGEYATRVD
jgi:predicted RNA-binding Zn-ribbon protein involved in translation (DUF1610 family)